MKTIEKDRIKRQIKELDAKIRFKQELRANQLLHSEGAKELEKLINQYYELMDKINWDFN